MINQEITERQKRLEQFLQHLESARQLEDDIRKYGLEAADLYFEDIDSDWLETWGDDANEPAYLAKLPTDLDSDDVVAVEVRKRLQNKSHDEIIGGLEYCLSQLTKKDRIFAAKDFLVGDVVVNGSCRASDNSDIDEVELLELAEDLMEKLREILG